LLLATPLTVCIAVLGRHVRSLRFLAVIFADEPALMLHVRFYQRLLARDEDEAGQLVNRKLQESGPVEVIDQVLMPTVTLVLQHRDQNEITEDDAAFVLDVIAETLQQLPTKADANRAAASIIGLATPTMADLLMLEMLRTAYGRERIAPMAPELTTEEALLIAIRQKPRMVCIVGTATTRGSELRNYCRRIRSALPDVGIVVLRPPLTEDQMPLSSERFKEAGADSLALSAKEAVAAIERFFNQPSAATKAASSPRPAQAHG
jgi:methanogenic corrinoid protein MtbC1